MSEPVEIYSMATKSSESLKSRIEPGVGVRAARKEFRNERCIFVKKRAKSDVIGSEKRAERIR